jgi:drug/metabolite transporter (DMT)-like permease
MGGLFGTDVRRGTLLSTGAAVWAAAFLIPYKQASLLADAEVVALALLIASAAWNTALAVVESRGHLRVDRASIWAAAALAVFSVTGNICSSNALTTLEPATTSVLLRTDVVFVALGSAVLLGERVSASLALGAALALVGLLMMRMPFDGGASFAGILWALGAANSFGAMVLVTRKVIHRIQPVAVNALRLWLAAAVLAAVPGVGASALAASTQLWLLATAAAFCGPFVSRLCIMYALRHVTAAYHVLISLSAPVFAFGLGYAFFGTVPTSSELVGGAIMLVGIALPVVPGLRAARAGATGAE